MISVGRPREKIKDLPLGVYPVKGRFYVRPVNEEMRRVFALKFPGRKCAPLGPDKAEARKLWVKLFVTDRDETAQSGFCSEIIERYETDILPGLHPETKPEHERYCKTLRKAFGSMRYAKSEAEASAGPFLRSMHITQYLRAQEKIAVYNRHGTMISKGRAVASNKEVQCFSRMFRLAKTLWGYTEYNPCLQVEYNHEEPRGHYATDERFMRVYVKAAAVLQCMMDLAQMHGARRGMLLKLSLEDIADPTGIWVTLNKKKKTDTPKRQLILWNDELRAVINRALELRAKVRGGQKNVEDATRAPLFLNRFGRAISKTGFNSMWQRARIAGGFGQHEFHFHDIKAKSVSDSPSLIDGMERGGHTDLRMAKRVYRRKPVQIIPLPRVSKKAN
jgi:integrase